MKTEIYIIPSHLYIVQHFSYLANSLNENETQHDKNAVTKTRDILGIIPEPTSNICCSQ